MDFGLAGKARAPETTTFQRFSAARWKSAFEQNGAI
jgi:hypothetical protein